MPNIVPLDAGDLSIDQYNRILDEFEDAVRTHVPPDSELDVRVTSDRAAITDWVSSDAADLLSYFSTLANMSTKPGQGQSSTSRCDAAGSFAFRSSRCSYMHVRAVRAVRARLVQLAPGHR